MDKKYRSTVSDREAKPRSKRLQKLGAGGSSGGGSTVVSITTNQSPGNDGQSHTHANKGSLDQITTDAQGYVNLTRLQETVEKDPDTGQENTVWGEKTEKAKAGWADKAGVAHDLDDDSPIRNQFLSKIADDVAAGHITFQQGLTAVLTAFFQQGAHFGQYVQGLAGAAIDAAGNGEFESLTARSYLKVFELIYNRLNALEGNTSFADVGTIDSVEAEQGGRLALTMRKRWDGDFTAFQPGDVIYGYVNNLNDAGSLTYYKAWAWVVSVDRVNNVLHVVPYAGNMTPAGTNHPLTEGMVITRWGNNIEANAVSYGNPDYSAVIKKRGTGNYVNVRQSSFFISSEDGNLVELMGVNKPILEPGNYGTVLGKLPAGLLDPKTSELINEDQPYLFARGIVVQDLIRVDYEGVVTRTANYRGQWDAQTAASETGYYRSTAGTYDTVTWKGCLWQCITSGTTDEPSDTTGSWVNMAGGIELPELNVWKIIPNTDVVTLRYDKDGHVTILPGAVSCTVLLTSTEDGTLTYNSSYDLSSRGVTLYYSLDGLNWREFIMGTGEPLELEDGTEPIEAESSTEDNPEALTIGGDDVSSSQIGDRIYFELRDTENVLARAVVPIIKDGKNGYEGRDGLMVYPAGVFDAETMYTATGETAPVVMYQNNFYVLKRGKAYSAADMPDNRKNPAADVANGGTDARWQIFDKFNAIFADIVMAEFAKLGSAVFVGDWLISQQGKRYGQESSEYQYFKDGSFTPNYAVNFKTGEFIANSGTLRGTIEASTGHIGGFEIGASHIGVNTDLGYSDNAGMSLFSQFIKFSNANWTHLAMIGANVLPASSGLTAQARFENTEENTFGTNYGILVYAENADNNIAIAAKGNIITDGFNGSYGYRPIDMITNTVVHRPFDANTWIIKCAVADSHICLPDKSDVRLKLGISASTPFSVRITIIADAANSKTFKVQGRNTSIQNSSGTKFLDSSNYPYRLNNNGQQQLTDGLEMGAGDVAEYQLVYDGTTYNAYLVNSRS